VILRVAVWLKLPALPAIFTANVPVVADDDAVRVRVDDALPPAAGVTVAGAKDAATPAGRPEILRPVGALKPFTLPTVTVVERLLPLAVDTLMELGETLRVKSGGGPLTVRLRVVV